MNLNIKKLNALPSTFEPSTLYFVRDAEGYLNVSFSNQAGTAVSTIVTIADIRDEVANSLGAYNNLTVYNTYAEMTAATPTKPEFAFVVDASGDTTVTSDSAFYIFNSTWTKVSEFESMDVSLHWDNIIGKPTSTPAQIDAAVAVAHSHANAAVLDGFSEDPTLGLMYKGEEVYTAADGSLVQVTQEW